MKNQSINCTDPAGLTQREFLYFASMATTGLFTGCVTNPVTGKSQFMAVIFVSMICFRGFQKRL